MNQPGLGPPSEGGRVFARAIPSMPPAAPPPANRRGAVLRKYRARAVTNSLADERVIDFVLSTDAVDRHADRIAVDGWNLDSYRRNPIVLWAHEGKMPPIGRARSIGVQAGVQGRVLKASAEFVDAATYPFADTIYRLLQAGFLNACSVGFRPIEQRPSDDPARPRGVDILAQELVEFSVVPVPANPEALVEARAFGIDTGPLADWLVRRLDEDAGDLDRGLLDQARRAALPLGQGFYSLAGPAVLDPDPELDPDDDPDDLDAPLAIDPALLDPERLAEVIADAIREHLAGGGDGDGPDDPDDPDQDDDDPEDDDPDADESGTDDPDDSDEGSQA